MKSHNILLKLKAALRAPKRKRLFSQAPITATFRHKKFAFSLVSIIIALCFLLSSSIFVQADEILQDVDEDTTPILMERLRKTSKDTESDIATNVADIVTNETDIATNTAAIAAIAVFVDRGDPASVDWTQATLTIDSAWHDLNLSSIVSAGATAVLLGVTIQDASTTMVMYFRKNGNTNAVNISKVVTQTANVLSASDVIVACDTDRVIEYYIETGMDGVQLWVKGWWY